MSRPSSGRAELLEIDDHLAARLSEAAAKQGTTVEAFAAEAVESALDHAESWVEDEAAYAQYRQTGESIPLEAAEKLEQLRALENGIPIAVVKVEHDSVGVDVPEDVARVERLLAAGATE